MECGRCDVRLPLWVGARDPANVIAVYLRSVREGFKWYKRSPGSLILPIPACTSLSCPHRVSLFLAFGFFSLLFVIRCHYLSSPACFSVAVAASLFFHNPLPLCLAFSQRNLASAGVEVIGHSQLAGSPKIPEWGIPLPQYPSVSLLNWNTGFGNARYWSLKLLLEHFAPGDKIYNTSVRSPSTPAAIFCAVSPGPGYPTTDLFCSDPAATLHILFADWGTPSGSCPTFVPDAKCTAGVKALAYAQQSCNGKNSCSLTPYPTLGDPCYEVEKRFVAVANCTTGGGGSDSGGAAIYALALTKPNGVHKLLVINKTPQLQVMQLAGATNSSVAHDFVDPRSVQASSPAGIGHECVNPACTAVSFLLVLPSPLCLIANLLSLSCCYG